MKPPPIATALAGAVVISFSAIFFRLADTGAVTAGFFRMAYSLPVLAAMRWSGRAGDTRSRQQRLLALGSGVLLALDVITWHLAIERIGAGLGTLIANTQVVMVPLATWALHRERPSPRALAAMPVVIIGLILITGVGRADTYGSQPLVGVLLAATAAFFYTGFLVAFRSSNRGLAPPAGPLMDAVAGSLVVLGSIGIATGTIDFSPALPEHGWLLALALGPQVLGWLAIGYALPRLPAAHTSFAILLQPVMTLIWGRLIFAESPGTSQLLGIALVLSGIAVVTVPGLGPAEATSPP
jgi:drug/metabolite transporter (DMT)-like permease